MIRRRLRRPSPALIVSIAALIAALAGTSYAAFKLPKNSVGSKQLKNNAVTTKKIKNGAVTGAKLKNGAVTGAKINLSSLGTVPFSSHANAADSATHADAVAGITRFRTTIGARGSSFSDAAATTLGTSGPLSLVGKCYSSAGTTTGSFFLRTTAPAQWDAYDNQFSGAPLSPGTDEAAAEPDESSTPPTIDLADPTDGTFAAITNNGSNYITGLVSVATNINGTAGCTFAGFTEAS
jgi:hypothetical protein